MASCQTWSCPTTAARHEAERPRESRRDERLRDRNTATFAPMSALRRSRAGPGPKENDERVRRRITAHDAKLESYHVRTRPLVSGRATS